MGAEMRLEGAQSRLLSVISEPFGKHFYFSHGEFVHSTPVTHPDASAVVLNLKELQSAFFHRHLDAGGLGIQTETFKTHVAVLNHPISCYITGLLP